MLKLNDGLKAIITIAIVVVAFFCIYHYMNQKPEFERIPTSEFIDKDSSLGQHILSEDFWDEMNLSQNALNNLSDAQITLLGVHNMSGYAVYDWYRILNLNNNWILIE